MDEGGGTERMRVQGEEGGDAYVHTEMTEQVVWKIVWWEPYDSEFLQC